jgi:hypothetical protein
METVYPSERWARARIFGEDVNVKLRKLVVQYEGQGQKEVPQPPFPKYQRLCKGTFQV